MLLFITCGFGSQGALVRFEVCLAVQGEIAGPHCQPGLLFLPAFLSLTPVLTEKSLGRGERVEGHQHFLSCWGGDPGSSQMGQGWSALWNIACPLQSALLGQ